MVALVPTIPNIHQTYVHGKPLSGYSADFVSNVEPESRQSADPIVNGDYPPTEAGLFDPGFVFAVDVEEAVVAFEADYAVVFDLVTQRLERFATAVAVGP